jgi:iron complex transport system substrate-binding protein
MAAARHSRALFLSAAAVTVAIGLAGCASPAEPEADGTTVETDLGTVTVPTEIDSVIVLEGRRDLDIVLALGLPLTGFPYEGEDQGLELEAPLAEATAAAVADGAEPMFLADEINLEVIAENAPSVIVSRIDDIEPIEAELNAIAPVLPVHSHSDYVTWQEDLLAIAEATGTTERAEEIIAEYDARVEEIATTYAAQIAATPVVSLGYDAEGTDIQATRLQNLTLAAVGGIASDALVEAQALTGEDIEFSPEQTLAKHADAGAILVVVETAEEWAALEADPLWNELPAVAAGNVVRTDKMTHEGGPITAMKVLDLIEQLYKTV